MISYKEALGLIAKEARPQPTHRVDRNEALGLVAAEDVIARLDVPSFDNSAMDGFALHAQKTNSVSIDNPGRFKVGHCLAAGDILESADQALAVEIMTGAKVPQGFDAVVQIEKVRTMKDSTGKTIEIEIRAPLQIGDNVRFAGEDLTAGQTIAIKGTRLHAGHIAAMAATGIHEVRVFDMPEIEIFTTGKEVSDSYHVPLKDGEIYNSNTPYLLCQFKASGIPASYAGSIGDDEQAFVDTLNVGTNARIVISSGAVSMGKWDFIPELLKKNGARIIFHGVGIKPGKPILFAVLQDGRYYFGLPGNPVSTAVGLRFFVQPLIRQLLDMAPEVFHYAELRHDFSKKGDLRNFLKARLDSDDHGQTHLTVLDGQQSFKISPLLDMNCWAILGEEKNEIRKDDSVCIAPMELFPMAF
ncbi:MAG: molybdopterin molybdotransferase MoeA [Rhodocyclaceae bacterium]|jgi:molybdopterin molybdotransferase|nr:molybdopterin molybdotransferase MoeA [Rhodocyclaceae bacterium]